MFAFQFSASVCRLWTNGIVFVVRVAIRAVKNVVGGNLNHPTALPLDGLGQVAWRVGIEFSAEIGVALGLIHSGVGRAIHDAVDVVFLNELPDGFWVGDVEFRHVCIKKGVLRMLFFQQLDFVSELSVAASNQYFHRFAK